MRAIGAGMSAALLVLALVGGATPAPPSELVVWSGAKPAGSTWAKMGPKGHLQVRKGAGMTPGTAALELRFDGTDWRGCGLNWKGWFPADACDDASAYTALIFHVRQETKFANANLSVVLVDNVKRAGTGASNALTVVGDGGLARIDGTWRRVVLPLGKFTQNKPLQLRRLWGIDFSHNGAPNATFHVDRIAFVVEKVAAPRFAAGPGYKASARLLPGKGHAIKDGIYGTCGLPRAKLEEYLVPITRWGGNPSSRFNWKLNVDNGAADWYFKNRGKLSARLEDSGYLKHVRDNQAFGATTYQTVPMTGWVAKDDHSYGFSVKKYGKQRGHEPGHADVGNGVGADGSHVTGNDPRDTSVPAPPEFVGEAVRFVVKHAGRADGKRAGVKYWALDNEPMLWHATHRDVFPKPLTYDRLWDRTVRYAEAIKKADPSAKVAGFCSWGWMDLYYSAADAGDDNYRTKPDFNKHGKVPLCEWFIKKCGDYKREKGKALVDVLDVHWYPQAQFKGQGPYLGKGMEVGLNELRLRSTRDLWDEKYAQESWIRNVEKAPVALLPRVKGWIAKHNPGMEVCLGEYNFGGGDNVTGGLAQAEAFGVLARERIDLAFIWHTPEGSQELAWQLFRSYDGKGGKFGDQFLPAESNHANLSVFAARRSGDGAVTVVVVNKSLSGACQLALELGKVEGALRTWRFDQDSGEKVVEVTGAARSVGGRVALTVPAASASMLVVAPARK